MNRSGRTILGITREPAYSPGKEEADSAILRLTFDWLAGRGVETRRAPGDDPDAWGDPPGLVLSMAQGEEALDRLARWEERGVPVLNTTRSVRACSRREALFARLEAAPFEGFRLPRTLTLAAGGESAAAEAARALEGWGFPVWLKRGDLHALG
ncbi:MAG: hypothetical protein ACE5IM_04420, partial [Nitrospinota bacterium]